jgi:hypothetical protein
LAAADVLLRPRQTRKTTKRKRMKTTATTAKKKTMMTTKTKATRSQLAFIYSVDER